jgi:hypothetical protein
MFGGYDVHNDAALEHLSKSRLGSPGSCFHTSLL